MADKKKLARAAITREIAALEARLGTVMAELETSRAACEELEKQNSVAAVEMMEVRRNQPPASPALIPCACACASADARHAQPLRCATK